MTSSSKPNNHPKLVVFKTYKKLLAFILLSLVFVTGIFATLNFQKSQKQASAAIATTDLASLIIKGLDYLRV